VNARDVDAVLQAVRFELYRENVSGALELAERAHAAHPDPRYAEQAARIRSWLTHLESREAYIAAQEAQYMRLRWRVGLVDRIIRDVPGIIEGATVASRIKRQGAGLRHRIRRHLMACRGQWRSGAGRRNRIGARCLRCDEARRRRAEGIVVVDGWNVGGAGENGRRRAVVRHVEAELVVVRQADAEAGYGGVGSEFEHGADPLSVSVGRDTPQHCSVLSSGVIERCAR